MSLLRWLSRLIADTLWFVELCVGVCAMAPLEGLRVAFLAFGEGGKRKGAVA